MLDEAKAMDAVFKDHYKVYAFAKLSYLDPEWELQVQHIRQLWNAVGNLIDHDEFFFHVFIWMCWTRATLWKLPHGNSLRRMQIKNEQ